MRFGFAINSATYQLDSEPVARRAGHLIGKIVKISKDTKENTKTGAFAKAFKEAQKDKAPIEEVIHL